MFNFDKCLLQQHPKEITVAGGGGWRKVVKSEILRQL